MPAWVLQRRQYYLKRDIFDVTALHFIHFKAFERTETLFQGRFKNQADEVEAHIKEKAILLTGYSLLCQQHSTTRCQCCCRNKPEGLIRWKM